MNKKNNYLTKVSVIGALYVVLTLVSAMFGLSGSVVQVRLSEALTILPYFFPEAILGLTVGCVIANLLTGCALWDVVFGSVATFLGAYFTAKIKNRWLLSVPPILSNAIIVPFILMYVYGVKESFWFIMLTVATGEIISCGVLGQMLYTVVDKNEIFKR